MKCTYCKSTENCDHLFALYDQTFDTIDGGYIEDVNVLDDMVYNYFNKHIKTKGITSSIDSSTLDDIWQDIVGNDDIKLNEGTGDYDFTLPSVNKLLFEILDRIIYPDTEEYEGGPGQSSTYLYYYSNDPEKTYTELLKKAKLFLKP